VHTKEIVNGRRHTPARVTSLPAHSLKDAEAVVERLKYDKNRTCIICMTGYVPGTDKSYVVPVALITEMYDLLTKPPAPTFDENDDLHYDYEDADRARAAEAATY
jgi:hypothetical protein